MRPLLVLLLLVTFPAVHTAAQDKGDGPVRLLYSAKNLSAGDLHSILEKHYEGVDTVKFVVDKPANLLSIRAGNQGALDDVLKTLASLDKTPRSIVFQGLVIEAAGTAEGVAPVELDRARLTGSADDVLNVARGWVKEGKVASVRSFQFTGLENQVCEDHTSQIVPRITGVTVTARGQFPNYSDTNIGTTFSVRPRITEAGEIVCELIYNHSELAADSVAEKKADGAVEPVRIRQGRAQTTVHIPSGRSVVISARDAGPEGPASLLVVSAAIANPNAAPVAAEPPAVNPLAAAGAPLRPGSAGTIPPSSMSFPLLTRLHTEDLAKTIKITDEQMRSLDGMSVEMKRMSAEMFARMRERADDGGASPQEELAALAVKRRELEERALAVLTAEQKKAYEAYSEAYSRSLPQGRNVAPPGLPSAPDPAFAAARNRDRLASINRSLERSPNQPSLYAMRGQAYLANEKWDEAIADFRRALELQPRNVIAITNLAAVLVLRGDEPGYRQFTDQILERAGNESSPAEKFHIADACLLRSDWLSNAAAAESLLQTAIEALPDAEPERAGRFDQGVVGPAGIRSSSITAEEVQAARGRLHILKSQPEEAVKLLKPFLTTGSANGRRLRPDIEVSSWCSLAVAQLSMGDKAAAAAALVQARQAAAFRAGSPSATGVLPTHELPAKVRLQLAEQILRDAGVGEEPASQKR